MTTEKRKNTASLARWLAAVGAAVAVLMPLTASADHRNDGLVEVLAGAAVAYVVIDAAGGFDGDRDGRRHKRGGHRDGHHAGAHYRHDRYDRHPERYRHWQHDRRRWAGHEHWRHDRHRNRHGHGHRADHRHGSGHSHRHHQDRGRHRAYH